MYVKNKIVTRIGILKPENYSRQPRLREGKLQINGEYSFDFFHEEDRSKWFEEFEKHKRLTDPDKPDYFYLGRQNVAKNYMKNTTLNSFVPNPVPYDLEEGPRAFVYNKLLGEMNIIKNHIMPELRERGFFKPVNAYMEKRFFEFDLSSFEISTMQVPDKYEMRTIFKLNFHIWFDLQAYIEWMIVRRYSVFHLDIYPHAVMKIIYTDGFPFVFVREGREDFYRAINQATHAYIVKNPKIVAYMYEKTKVRLDKVKGLKIVFNSTKNEIEIKTDENMSMFGQLIIGNIDIFKSRTPNQSFTIQRIDTTHLQAHLTVGSSVNPFVYLALAYVIFGKTRRMPSKQEIEKAIRLNASGKLKVKDLLGI